MRPLLTYRTEIRILTTRLSIQCVGWGHPQKEATFPAGVGQDYLLGKLRSRDLTLTSMSSALDLIKVPVSHRAQVKRPLGYGRRWQGGPSGQGDTPQETRNPSSVLEVVP